MLIIERLGIESNIALQTVNTMEIFTKPNQHVKMVLSGILNMNIIRNFFRKMRWNTLCPTMIDTTSIQYIGFKLA